MKLQISQYILPRHELWNLEYGAAERITPNWLIFGASDFKGHQKYHWHNQHY